MIFSLKAKQALSAGAIVLLTAFAYLSTDEELNNLRASKPEERGLSVPSGRGLSIDLGDGNCVYTPPEQVVPDSIKFRKTLIAGFPSGDKRMTYIQMEALTGWPSKDDWAFAKDGYSNHPFIKTNYPHPAGTWSWGSEANEVALVVQFIRRSMVEYGDILGYQDGAKNYEEERQNVESRYGERMDTNDFYKWRDAKVMAEIYRYGSTIDYWMENGLRRDPFSHKPIDQAMWEEFTKPTPITSLADEVHICHKTSSTNNPFIEMVVSSKVVDLYIDHGDFYGLCADAEQDTTFWTTAPKQYTASRDPRCQNIVPGTCNPKILISADKLRDYTEGPIETDRIAKFLNRTMHEHMIDDAAWPCIWNKIIHENRGPMTFDDRKISEDPNFSAFMLEEMIYELSRMITKYSAPAWVTSNDRAVRLVDIFTGHRALLQTELDEVKTGVRKLSDSDYMGPKERQG